MAQGKRGPVVPGEPTEKWSTPHEPVTLSEADPVRRMSLSPYWIGSVAILGVF